MRDVIEELIEKVVAMIEKDWYDYEEIRPIVMQAHNLYNLEENNGYNVIYDITCKKDLEELEKELSKETIGRLYLNYKLGKTTEYFFFEKDSKNKIPTQIIAQDWVLAKIKGSLRDVILAMLENPFYHKEYKELYAITIGGFISTEDANNGW